MKASRFSDAQKAFILSKARRGAGGGYLPQGRDQPGDLLQLEEEVRRLLPTEMRRLKQLEDENSKLRKVVADLTRQGDAAGRPAPKNLRPVRKRKLVMRCAATGTFRSGEPAGVLVDTSTYHYRSRRPGQAALEQRIKEICQTRVRYGYRRIHVLLRREGMAASTKARRGECTVS